MNSFVDEAGILQLQFEKTDGTVEQLYVNKRDINRQHCIELRNNTATPKSYHLAVCALEFNKRNWGDISKPVAWNKLTPLETSSFMYLQVYNFTIPGCGFGVANQGLGDFFPNRTLTDVGPLYTWQNKNSHPIKKLEVVMRNGKESLAITGVNAD